MTLRLLQLVGGLHIAGGLVLFTAGFSPATLRYLESFLTGNENFGRARSPVPALLKQPVDAGYMSLNPHGRP